MSRTCFQIGEDAIQKIGAKVTDAYLEGWDKVSPEVLISKYVREIIENTVDEAYNHGFEDGEKGVEV